MRTGVRIVEKANIHLANGRVENGNRTFVRMNVDSPAQNSYEKYF